MKTKIVIEVGGGMVQSVWSSSGDIEVQIIDIDSLMERMTREKAFKILAETVDGMKEIPTE